MNIGLHDGICEEKHRQAMGEAIWLYMWLVRRQTKPNGFVLAGSPITYDLIHRDSHYPIRSLQRWMNALKFRGYIEVRYLNFHKMRIRVLKAKKFAFRQISLPLEESAKCGGVKSAISGGVKSPDVAECRDKCGGVKQSGIWRKIESREQQQTTNHTSSVEGAAASAAAAAAFQYLGFEPFGEPAFQKAWVEEWQSRKSQSEDVDAMERCARRCRSQQVSVPALFFLLKREFEKDEVLGRFKVTPL